MDGFSGGCSEFFSVGKTFKSRWAALLQGLLQPRRAGGQGSLLAGIAQEVTAVPAGSASRRRRGMMPGGGKRCAGAAGGSVPGHGDPLWGHPLPRMLRREAAALGWESPGSPLPPRQQSPAVGIALVSKPRLKAAALTPRWCPTAPCWAANSLFSPSPSCRSTMGQPEELAKCQAQTPWAQHPWVQQV